MTARITRRMYVAAIGTAILPRRLNAQTAATPTLGVLDSAAATAAKLSGFYEGLKVEGFLRGQNLTVEYHSAEGDYARLPQLAADLVNRRVSLITAFGAPAALAAKAATAKIPVVFAISANPIQIGLVTSLDHPGTNLTGVAGMAVGREQKRLDLLRAVIPMASAFGFLVNPQNAQQDVLFKDMVASAAQVGVRIELIRASTERDLNNVFAGLTQLRIGGLVIADDELFVGASAELGALAARHGLATIFQGAAFTAAGGLISYGNKFAELYHQAGAYSGMVLAGAAPADLPIYRSTAIEMIVNLRSARSLGLGVPQAVIDQATTLIR